jgi:hypothetical protein
MRLFNFRSILSTIHYVESAWYMNDDYYGFSGEYHPSTEKLENFKIKIGYSKRNDEWITLKGLKHLYWTLGELISDLEKVQSVHDGKLE